MTKHEIEQEISHLLNAAPRGKHREVEKDVIYTLCVKQGDWEAALARVYGLIFGTAGNLTQLRRMMKRKRKAESIEEFC